ncbi:MAG TPA: sigma-70 family RNA polymerase sigma factor [Verrucomicrobiae bacterium]|nr:sigma-70 family RNA polymerase sigma factor [Verrucomicrobiae bacterium]
MSFKFLPAGCHILLFRGHVWVMNIMTMDSAGSDEQLYELASAGDCEAFGKIVQRYQTLICSVAYSACGRLGASEDLAQQTFITAWQRLRDLREPAKLRQWLCGIVRNLAANSARREFRRGGEPAPLEVAVAEPVIEADPASHAVASEEEELLWRALSKLPANYREPLVLFYREDNSIAEVGALLDLTEDTVRQRLFRGRAMLRDEMTALVETTLSRTKPGGAFTAGVLVALPVFSGSTASAALAVKSATAAASGAGKSLLGQLGFGAFLGPAIGVVFSYLGTRAAASVARSPEERLCILRFSRRMIAFCLGMSLALAAVLSQAGKLYTPSPVWIPVGVIAWAAVLGAVAIVLSKRFDRDVARIRRETNTTTA